MTSQNEAKTSHTPHHLFSKGGFGNKGSVVDINRDKMVRGTVLGVDFGLSKIGLAIAETETKIAFAYGELENNNQFFDKLGEIIKKEEISLIVLGELAMQGGNIKSFEIREVGEKIKKLFNIEVGYQEEMFTTKMAGENLKAKGEKNIKKSDNAEAARIILQDYINSK